MPLVLKLPHDEQVRLVKLTLAASQRPADGDRAAYLAAPPLADEFSSDDDPLARDADGWEAFADKAR